MANEDQKNDQNCFYHLTTTDISQVIKILTKASREEAIVLIDEFNSASMEKVLNQFLSGKDLAGNPVHPGFLVFGTGNPASFRGRQILSAALKNRMQITSVPDYSPSE